MLSLFYYTELNLYLINVLGNNQTITISSSIYESGHLVQKQANKANYEHERKSILSMRAIFISTCLCGMKKRKENYNLGKQVNDNYRKQEINTQNSK